MAPNKAAAEEYPVDIVDLSDDFKSSKTLDLVLDEEHKVYRYWIHLKCMKWSVLLLNDKLFTFLEKTLNFGFMVKKKHNF